MKAIVGFIELDLLRGVASGAAAAAKLFIYRRCSLAASHLFKRT